MASPGRRAAAGAEGTVPSGQPLNSSSIHMRRLEAVWRIRQLVESSIESSRLELLLPTFPEAVRSLESAGDSLRTSRMCARSPTFLEVG